MIFTLKKVAVPLVVAGSLLLVLPANLASRTPTTSKWA